jgi:hypothetical protein
MPAWASRVTKGSLAIESAAPQSPGLRTLHFGSVTMLHFDRRNHVNQAAPEAFPGTQFSPLPLGNRTSKLCNQYYFTS